MQCFCVPSKKIGRNKRKVELLLCIITKKKKKLKNWTPMLAWKRDISPQSDVFEGQSLAQQSHSKESDLIENRSWKSLLSPGGIRLPNREDYWQYVPMDFFFHNIRVVMLREVDAEGQRLMGSCGKEMDGWVKWPGAARTEKGWAAQRRETTWVWRATRAAGWSSPSDKHDRHVFVFIYRAPTWEMSFYITSLLSHHKTP